LPLTHVLLAVAILLVKEADENGRAMVTTDEELQGAEQRSTYTDKQTEQ